MWEYAILRFLRLDTTYPRESWHSVVELMLTHGAKPNQLFPCKPGQNKTMLHLCVEHVGQRDYPDSQLKKCLVLLLQRGAKPENTDSENNTVYQAAEKRGRDAQRILEEAIQIAGLRKRLKRPRPASMYVDG